MNFNLLFTVLVIFTTKGYSMPPDQHFEWARTKREIVYDAPGRARFPSVAVADDALLVIFTQQTPEQEQECRGDLMLVRSTDQGNTWSQAKIVFRGDVGEPRASDTMTTLHGGRIVVPFAELSDERSKIRLLSSSDQGRTWRVTDVTASPPMTWWAPSGRVIETPNGTLVMPIYGAKSHEHLQSTLHGCGLLRSSDGGKTWNDFSWIAEGPDHIVGASPNSWFGFQGPSVSVLPDDRWLAMVSARRLNRTGDGPSPSNAGPGSPQVLCRLWSTDQGRTWTSPDQILPGAWPALAVLGNHTLCVNTHWCAWGEMRLLVSRDGFESFFQELPLMIRGWVQGRGNNPKEAPLPPAVPNLADKWPYEHYGFPSAVPLDKNNLIVVFGRTQRGTGSYEYDPRQWNQNPIEKERISAVFYRRSERNRPVAAPLAKRTHPKGRWVLAERVVVDDFGHATDKAPNGDLVGVRLDSFYRSNDGGRSWQLLEGATVPAEHPNAFGILSSGRWLVASIVETLPRREGTHTHMGMVGGYPTTKITGQSRDRHIIMHWTDDQAKTWQSSEPIKGGLKKWATPCASHFLESPNGTIALPIFGCVTDEDMSSYSASNGVIRSHDNGETWDDFSFVFRTNPPGPEDYQPEPRYTEMDIVELANGNWVAYSRHERLSGGPMSGATAVALSTDYGRTWTETGGSLQGVSQQKGLTLPDGAIALTYRSHSWQAPGVAITYDEGRSFAYAMGGPYETENSFVTAENEFIVFTGRSHRSDMFAGVYRWIAQE